jgi:hypothetical protein
VALLRTDVSEESISRFLRCVLQMLVTADFPSSLILSTLMMEAMRSSETSVPTRAAWRHIPEDVILHSHRRENLKSYIALIGWVCSGDVTCFLWLLYKLKTFIQQRWSTHVFRRCPFETWTGHQTS